MSGGAGERRKEVVKRTLGMTGKLVGEDARDDEDMKWPGAIVQIAYTVALVLIVLGFLWFVHGANISVG